MYSSIFQILEKVFAAIKIGYASSAVLLKRFWIFIESSIDSLLLLCIKKFVISSCVIF